MHFSRLQKTITSQLTYDSVPLVFVEKNRFLGLIWDRKLSWEPHIISTRSRALSALNALKMVSNKKWGVRRESLLLFYKSYVLPIFDYGSVVYSSAKDKFLNKLNTVHHLGIRIATGAYRSSPVESLYVESGIPPLSLRREKLIVNYVSKIAASPFNPVKNILFSPLNTTGFSVHKPKPLAFRYRDILPFRYHLASSEILPFSRDVPPWFGKEDLPLVDTELCAFKKAETPPQVYKQKFLQKMNDGFQNHTKVYTDGSKDENGVGCAFTIPDRNIVKKYSLNKDASIFHAELYAILQSLIMIIDMSMEKAIIITNSLSCLQALVKLGHPNPLVQKIQSLFTSYQAEIKFFWCPSHVGIAGNESADKLAKEAINMNNIAHSELFVDEIKVIIKKSLFEDWNHSWFNTSPHDNKLRAIKNSVSKWKTSFQKSRLDEVCLMRLRVGHCNYFTHVYLFKKEDRPMCCNEPVTVEHILMKCPRLRFRPSNFPLSSVPEILKNDPDSVNVVMRFLKKDNFMRMI
ncbi:hypothetical protein WDU94_012504 [Cyamophila willieti]